MTSQRSFESRFGVGSQYTQRITPSYTSVMGTAHPDALVTLVDSAGNNTRALRQEDYFYGELPVTNYLGPVSLSITNFAVLDTGTEQLITNSSGAVLIPPTPQGYTHDANGNLTSDGVWNRTWNAENRMTRVESASDVAVQARKREDWTYLPDGRWIERIVWTNNGTAYVAANTNRYIWDGKILLAVLDHTNGLIMSFMRGLDLSGTIGGAGGVGGVLAVNFAPSNLHPSPSSHFVSYDGNGNVIALTDAATGESSAVFEYGPFGELVRSTGPMADLMPLRFSTMYADDVTGDVKYLFRDLETDEGRWTSKDPIKEKGGINLCAFIRNNPANSIDYLGNKIVPCPGCGPDITDPLTKVLASIEASFHTEADYKTKRKACDYLAYYNPITKYLAWDIADLYAAGADAGNHNWGTSCGTMKGGEGSCAGTVTYKGSCVYASAANYVMWGKMMSLCSSMPDDGAVGISWFSLENAIRAAHAWKNHAGDTRASMHCQVEQFVKLGYNGSSPDFDKCEVGKCAASSCTVNGKFSWTWDPIPGHRRL